MISMSAMKQTGSLRSVGGGGSGVFVLEGEVSEGEDEVWLMIVSVYLYCQDISWEWSPFTMEKLVSGRAWTVWGC